MCHGSQSMDFHFRHPACALAPVPLQKPQARFGLSTNLPRTRVHITLDGLLQKTRATSPVHALLDWKLANRNGRDGNHWVQSHRRAGYSDTYMSPFATTTGCRQIQGIFKSIH